MISNPYIDDCFEAVDFILEDEFGVQCMHDMYHLVDEDEDRYAEAKDIIEGMLQGATIALAGRMLARFEGPESAERFLVDVQLAQMEHAENCEHCRGETEAN